MQTLGARQPFARCITTRVGDQYILPFHDQLLSNKLDWRDLRPLSGEGRKFLSIIDI